MSASGSSSRSNRAVLRQYVHYGRPIIIFVTLIWLIEIADRLLFDGNLDQFGIVPWQLERLSGIIFAPFLHNGFSHVLANTLPLMILGTLVIIRSRRNFWVISGLIVFISGLGIWLIGPPLTIHIGASSIIFGYFAYLIASAYYERSMWAIVAAAVVIILYGGMVQGLLPQGNGISWQGHLFGFIGGLMAAKYVARPNKNQVASAG
jgi:membrane associated rhomboid family serine protease